MGFYVVTHKFQGTPDTYCFHTGLAHSVIANMVEMFNVAALLEDRDTPILMEITAGANPSYYYKVPPDAKDFFATIGQTILREFETYKEVSDFINERYGGA